MLKESRRKIELSRLWILKWHVSSVITHWVARNSSFKICIEWNFQLSKTSKPWLGCFMPYAKQHNENMMHTKTADIFCKTAKKFCAKSTNFSFEKLIFAFVCQFLNWILFLVEMRRLTWRQTPSSIWHEIAMIYRAWIMSRIAEIIIIWTVEASWTLFHLGF